jgi:hypothetical protein
LLISILHCPSPVYTVVWPRRLEVTEGREGEGTGALGSVVHCGGHCATAFTGGGWKGRSSPSLPAWRGRNSDAWMWTRRGSCSDGVSLAKTKFQTPLQTPFSEFLSLHQLLATSNFQRVRFLARYWPALPSPNNLIQASCAHVRHGTSAETGLVTIRTQSRTPASRRTRPRPVVATLIGPSDPPCSPRCLAKQGRPSPSPSPTHRPASSG